MRRAAYLASLGVVFTVPWENVIQFPGFGTIARLVGVVAAFLWLTSQFAVETMEKPERFHVLVFAFVMWSGLTFFWSMDQDLTMVRFLTLIQLTVFLLILWDLYRTPAAIRSALQAYVLGAFVSLAAIFANYFTSNVGGFEGRVTAGAFKFDQAGLILALGVPIAWHLARSAEPRTTAAKWLQLVNYAYVPAGIVGLALTGTRTALLALFPAAIFVVWSLTGLRRSRRVGAILFLVVAGLVVAWLVPPESAQRLGTTLEEIRSGQFSARAEIWHQGLDAFFERPLEGVGAGAFEVAVARQQVAHNTALSVAAETGVIGLTLLGFAVMIAIRKVGVHPRRERHFWLALLWGLAIGAASLTWEHKKITWLVLGLLVASAASVVRQRSGAERWTSAPYGRPNPEPVNGTRRRSIRLI